MKILNCQTTEKLKEPEIKKVNDFLIHHHQDVAQSLTKNGRPAWMFQSGKCFFLNDKGKIKEVSIQELSERGYVFRTEKGINLRGGLRGSMEFPVGKERELSYLQFQAFWYDLEKEEHDAEMRLERIKKLNPSLFDEETGVGAKHIRKIVMDDVCFSEREKEALNLNFGYRPKKED